jgi:hypothetical protein
MKRKTILKEASVLLIAALMILTCLIVTANTNIRKTSNDKIIVGDSVYIFGFNHTAVGNAVLTIVNNTLVVSNIGSSGEDGVRISIPQKNLADIGIETIGAGYPYIVPIGAYIQSTARGVLNGVPNQFIQSWREEKTDSANVTLTLNTSGINPKNITTYYYLNETLVNETVYENDGTNLWQWLSDADAWALGNSSKHNKPWHDYSVQKFHDPEGGEYKRFVYDAKEHPNHDVKVIKLPKPPSHPIEWVTCMASYSSGNNNDDSYYTEVLLTAALLPALKFVITNETAIYEEPPIEITPAGGFGSSAVIKNVGNMTFTNVNWSITLNGSMMFFGQTKSGVIDTLAPGESITIKDPLIIGFGQTGIAVKVGGFEKDAIAFVLLFFTLGVK